LDNLGTIRAQYKDVELKYLFCYNPEGQEEGLVEGSSISRPTGQNNTQYDNW
jgi:hypothetical protein